jgi:hypothetical protein
MGSRPRSLFSLKNARQRRNEQIRLGMILLLGGLIASRLVWPEFYGQQQDSGVAQANLAGMMQLHAAPAAFHPLSGGRE